jgi:uncharacterized Zn finger protein (UPF0148 family)
MNEDMVNVPITTAPIEKKSQSLPSECKICGTPALYQYYGTVVCQSCKIFFRRNAKVGLIYSEKYPFFII